MARLIHCLTIDWKELRAIGWTIVRHKRLLNGFGLIGRMHGNSLIDSLVINSVIRLPARRFRW